MLTRALLLQMASNKKIESFFRHNPRMTALSRKFVAGETLEQVIVPVRELNSQGLAVSLDFLGESVTSEKEVAVVVDSYLRTFQTIRSEGLNANVSIKLTAIGLDLDPDLCYRNMVRLLNAAGNDQFIRLDMEGSAYTQRTLDLFYRLWEGETPYRNVGVVIQAYLHRSADDIERLIRSGVRVRLCKGAYKEPASIAYQSREDVDASFVRLMQRLLADGNYPGIATHDGRMIEATKAFARENAIATDRYEFQMLYGVRRDLQLQLRREGFNVRIYTPFGTHWYAYFMRRLAERPANLVFALRSIVGK